MTSPAVQLKRTISLMIAMVLAYGPTTMASTADSNDSEELTEIFESYPQVRKDETLAELYDRVETRLGETDKNYVAKIFNGHAKDKGPVAKFKENKITLQFLQKELALEFVEKKASFSVLANGQPLPKTALEDPAVRYQFLEKVLSEKKQASGWYLSLLIPQAHADWSQYLPLIGTGVMVIGAYLLMKRQQKAQAKANANPVCTAPAPACCAVGTGYVVHTNGCCQQIGGLGAGSPSTCPLGGANSPYSTPSPVTGSGTSSGTR